MKRIVFITGTRADFGKLKLLMKAIDSNPRYECFIYVSGMHLLENHGSTYEEVQKEGYKNIHVAFDINYTNNMSLNLGATITSFTEYILTIHPDMIIVHGDRIDALAAAISGALNNIRVAHIEGGEVSGTIDESIRHAISKFAHIHYTCNSEATRRLVQMGEEESLIHEIGSPDIDIMLSDSLPSLNEVKSRYEICFTQYAILMFHPVTTESKYLEGDLNQIIDAVLESCRNYIIIYPNNDMGSDIIIKKYSELSNYKCLRIFPSIRFEYFLTLLRNADFILGNSSAGIREAGIYGIPAIDIGSRQEGRYSYDTAPHVQHVGCIKESILKAIEKHKNYRVASRAFGKGRSKDLFLESMEGKNFWNKSLQKKFIDLGE